MKKLYLKCLLLGILSFININAVAYDCIVDGIYYNLNKTDKTAIVTYWSVKYDYNDGTYHYSSDYKGSITIPSTIIYDGTEFTINSIGRYAFANSKNLTSVTIPNSVTEINRSAFLRCVNLVSVVIPNSVTTIGNYAFQHCNSIADISIPNSVISIEEYAFSYCSGLTSVTIPNSVTTIGDWAFWECSNLTSITIPNSVISIGTYAFDSCSSLTSFTIPNSVTTIKEGMFRHCTGLTSVMIPNSVTTIEDFAFYDCSSFLSFTIPNFITTMGDCVFEKCSGLESIILSTSMTTTGEYTFADCVNLSSVIIPNSVETIGEGVFYGCSALEFIDIPTSVITIDNGAFYKCSELKSITIPNSVTSIGSSAFRYCSDLTSVVIPSSVTSIGNRAFSDCIGLTSVIIPSSVNRIGKYAFSDCIGLTSVTSFITDVFETGEYTFLNDDEATLYVLNGLVSTYQSTRDWNRFKNIVSIDKVNYFTLNIRDEQNQNINNHVNIVWYDGEGKQIGTGNTLNGIDEDADIYYSVLLDEELGRVYREVKMQKVDKGENTITCKLEKIGRVMLEGRVTAADIDKNTAMVSVKQMLNGKYEENYQTQTNEQGVFQVEVYDDEADIIISGDGYFDATLHRDGFGGNGNVGTIPLNLITGFTIAANINIEKAVATGESEEMTIWTEGLNNIEFSLFNTTKNKDITDFTVQNGNVIIRSGADVGDEICLVAKSKQSLFTDATTSFILEEGAKAFNLQLTERGGLDAVCELSNNAGTSGYLYNSDGVLVSMGSYIGETLEMRHIPSGVYTLVSIGRSLLLGSMTKFSDIASVGLTEGEDYTATRIEIADGELKTVRVNEVPQLDETKFYYTDNNTYFSADKSSILAGNYLTLSAHLDFKPEYVDNVDEVTLTIDLPNGCQMVKNSVIANHQMVAHTVNANRVNISLTKELCQSQVRFCVIPIMNKSYTLTAIASFEIGGAVQQPIGTIQFEAKGFSLSVPQLTANTNITISGTAKGHSEVSIYDNEVLIGKTTSKADGTWITQAELFKPRSHSFHDIYAKIITEDDMELTSETKQVEYDKNYLVPAKVTMTYYNGWYKENKIVKFNLLEGTTTPSSYPFYHGTDFTFLADFTRNDTTQIKDVYIKVLNSDGTVRTLPAIYNGKQNHWVATTKYSSSSRLPRNVTVEYEYYSKLSDEDRKEDIIEEANKLVSTAYLIKDYFDEKVEMTPIEDSENHVLFECRTSESQSPLLYRIEGIDYAVMEELMKTHQFTYAENEEGIVGTYWESTKNGMIVYAVDITNAQGFKMTLNNTTASTKAKAKDFKPVIESLKNSVSTGQFLDGFLEHFGNLVDLLTGIKEYWSVKGDFENMCNTIIQYQNTLLKENKKTFNKILAKCSDGSYKLTTEKREQYFKAIQATSDVESIFAEQYYDYLQEYKNKLRASVGTFIGTLGLGKAIGAVGKSSKFINSGMNKTVNDFVKKFGFSNMTLNTSASILSSLTGTAAGKIIDLFDKIFDYKDFNKVKDKVQSWSSDEYLGLLKNYIDLQKGIERNYSKCKKDPNDNDEKEDEPTDDKSDFRGKGTTPILDPSGFVYEAVLSNRLEDVTTTCYQQENGEAVLWNAEDYSQKNPLKTDEAGFYRWDVPQGMWQVKYEKEGYETTYSEWLPVPPPQLDVNVGMKQSTPPSVTQMRGFESGITIDLSKYMLPATLNETNITVTRNGFDEKGHIELMNEEKEPLSEQTFASKVKFVPEALFNSSDLVVVTVHKEVESYCGVNMVKDHVETVKIESEIKSIVADSAISVPYQSEKELRILVLPTEASAGKTLHVRSSSTMIASVSSTEVTIDQDGAATLTLGGELPGGAIIDYSVEGTDLTATSKVQVIIGHDLVATPTASIRSGETIESGTVLTLSCETEGATIYYTLDGSCPCDETTRYRYDGPITIASDVIVKAIAVKEGMDDSDIATFVYLVNGINRVLVDNNIHIGSKDQTIIVTGAEGANCQIYDLQGRIAGGRSHLTNQSRFKVKSAGIYLLHITLPNGETTVGSVFVK